MDNTNSHENHTGVGFYLGRHPLVVDNRLAGFLRYLAKERGFDATELIGVVNKPHNWDKEFKEYLNQ